MPQFYARYIPPVKASNESQSSSEPKAKRKHDEDSGESGSRKISKKLKVSGQPKKTAGTAAKFAHESLHDAKTQSEGEDVLSKYSIRESTNKHGTATLNVRNGVKPNQTEATNGVSSNHKRGQSPDENNSPNESVNVIAEDQSLHQTARKHASVLSKFEKSKVRSQVESQRPSVDDNDSDDDAQVEVHGLEPIPQPEAVEDAPYKQNFSSLPSWQAKPLRITKLDAKTFDEIGVSGETLANLKRAGMHKAFPIQQAVIPLFSTVDVSLASDICVSATTGSGKTLAYVLPIIEDLRKSREDGLRAVIVVPTRELVKQVCDTFEMCAAGSGLCILTAVGTKSLSEEQAIMMEEEQVYDPHEYQQQQDAPVDWLTFDLERAIETALQKPAVTTTNFVTHRRVKGDILITTPGRLVDHLKNTPDFDLNRVKWLVVDEADRLLNESYQQWLEVVMPALESRNATKEVDDILTSMRMDVPPRIVRKILLSATMTRDISKLNALKLYNPKLVILTSSLDPAPEQGLEMRPKATSGEVPGLVSSETFQIPASLSESILTFKEGAERPLILLQLLEQHLGLSRIADGNQNQNSATNTFRKDEDTSSSGTDSSDDSSSDSESDSNSSTTSSVTASSEPTASSSSSGDESTNLDPVIGHSQSQNRKNSQSAQARTPRALVFARSTASASRLSRLLALIRPDLTPQIATLTRSTASSASSRKALSSFRNGKTTILIATDRASRGIDVPGLENVINYDIPSSALTYLHRVGRTARAGSQGHSWTLVEHREGRWFWNEIGGKSKDCKISRVRPIRKVEIRVDDEELRSKYENALQQLGDEVRVQ